MDQRTFFADLLNTFQAWTVNRRRAFSWIVRSSCSVSRVPFPLGTIYHQTSRAILLRSRQV
jgi:hypothetical protein